MSPDRALCLLRGCCPRTDTARELIREWHFKTLPDPRAFLQSGHQVSWDTPRITLRWQSRVTGKGRYSDGERWEKTEDLITLRCQKGPPREIERWDSDDDQSGSSLRAYLIQVRNRGGYWEKSDVLFEHYRSWAVEGDSGHEASASFMDLLKGCEWYGH